MKQVLVYLFILSVTLVSCKRESATNESHLQPAILTIKGYVVPSDSVLPPDTTCIKIPNGVPVRMSPPFALSTNQSNIPLSLKISKMITTTRHIGAGEYKIPSVVQFNESKKMVGFPVRVQVKEPLYKEINPGSFFYYNTTQGLLHDQIRALAQDSIGNIWIGTDRGLSRYDGKDLYHFTENQGLVNELINVLFIDSKQNIWISTYEGGVTRYDGKYFTKISTQEGLPHELVNCIFEDRHNRIWFGTRRGLVMYEEDKLTIFTTENGLSANDVRSIIEDGSGKMWIATYGGGISIYDGDSFSVFTTKEGLIQDHISLLFRDSKNNIWISTAFMGIIKYDGRALTSYTTKEGLGNNSIRSILEDRDGNMWFGNSNGNLTRFDGSAMRVYGKSDGLVAEAIRSSLQDKNGNIWFGTRGAGLVRFEGRLFSHYTEQEGLTSARISNINEDHNGKLWISTFGGHINILTEGVSNSVKRQYIQHFGPESGFNNRFVFKTVTDSEGRIWIASDFNGLVMYNGSKLFNYDEKSGIPGKTVTLVETDNSGRIWLSTMRTGISLLDGDKLINYRIRNGISGNHLRSFLQDSKNNIWLGTAGGGVTKFDGKSFIHFNKKHGFFTDTINDIIEDNRGIIWMASVGSGLIRYDGESFIRYSEESGLKSNALSSIIQDRKGDLWIGTRYGLYQIKKRVLESIDTINRGISLNSYGVEQGFMGMECRKEALHEASDGTIWIGTENRLTAYHGGSTTENEIPPSLQITNIQLFNEDVPWSSICAYPDSTITLKNGIKINHIKIKDVSEWYAIPQNLRLNRKSNYITFQFIATTHSKTSKIKYQYMLEGLDKNWSSSTERTEVSYGNLKQGNYTFRVKSLAGNGLESNESSFSFKIKPSWWETIFVQILVILLVIYLLLKYIRHRTKTLNKEKEQLENRLCETSAELEKSLKRAQILNHEKEKVFSIISNDLRGSISSFLGITKTMKSAQSINNLLDNLLQWSAIQQNNILFNPEKININDAFLNDLGQLTEQAKEKEISITHKIPVKLEIEADLKMLSTIFRNLISNSIKFTPRGGAVNIKIDTKSKEDISIIITDNGIGMTQDTIENIFTLNIETGRSGTEGEPSTGLGLLICNNLIKKHSGRIEIISEIKKGSKVIVSLPRRQDGN
jgi:ligand-binding sensor domain-containing protein/signal transduction histidine kinase